MLRGTHFKPYKTRTNLTVISHSNRCSNGAFLSTCQASMTLEAAVVFPLVAGFLAFLLFFFQVLLIQEEVYEDLSYASRRTAAMTGISESEVGELAAAEAFFLEKASQQEEIEEFVYGGKAGVLLISSDFSGDYVDLKAVYRIQFPVGFFSFRGITIAQESKSRKWTGTRGSQEESFVYITPSGEAYHKSQDCPYLDLSISSHDIEDLVDLRNANGQIYRECEECTAKDTSDYVTVYLTDYGEAYHTNLQCPGLKRTIQRVTIDQVGQRHACSKCYGKQNN